MRVNFLRNPGIIQFLSMTESSGRMPLNYLRKLHGALVRLTVFDEDRMSRPGLNPAAAPWLYSVALRAFKFTVYLPLLDSGSSS
jgi:hypothetical protein